MTSAYFVTSKAMIWAVTVVPILAPMMMPMAWTKVMRPAVMKPTTSTVVTEEDWMTAVTKAPADAALKRLVVNEASTSFMRGPEIFFNAVGHHLHAEEKDCQSTGEPHQNGGDRQRLDKFQIGGGRIHRRLFSST